MLKKIFIATLTAFLVIPVFADGNHHQLVEAEKPYPTINLELMKDAKNGYNLWIQTTNFRFVPEKVNQANSGNEGHVHIYINGEKYRHYSAYYHLPSKMLKKGVNTVKVTLNANDHSPLSAEGVAIEDEIQWTPTAKDMSKKSMP